MDQLGVEFFLGSKVVVQGPLCDVGEFSDLAQGYICVLLFVEQALGRIQNIVDGCNGSGLHSLLFVAELILEKDTGQPVLYSIME